MPFQVAAVQIAPKKADYACNLMRLGEVFAQADAMSPRPDVLVLPEAVLSGYFLEGGVRDVAQTREVVFADLLDQYRKNAASGLPMDVALGFYELYRGTYHNAALYATLTPGNGCSVEARAHHVHHKFFLPTYGVFDEKRFVSRGRTIQSFDTRFCRAAMLICEDVWHSVAATLAALDGAQVIYVLSASPGRDFAGEDLGNLARWKRILPEIAAEHNVWVVYSGLVGFEGGKGFTGSSCVIDPWGKVRVMGSVLNEELVTAPIDLEEIAVARAASPMLANLESALPDVAIAMDALAKRPHWIWTDTVPRSSDAGGAPQSGGTEDL
ncbi:MAG: nitrilase-related carbon-nitrogen hydrolase [Chthonomonadales bacterium]